MTVYRTAKHVTVITFFESISFTDRTTAFAHAEEINQREPRNHVPEDTFRHTFKQMDRRAGRLGVWPAPLRLQSDGPESGRWTHRSGSGQRPRYQQLGSG